MSQFAVILPAAGKSSRFAGKDKKPFTNLDGRAVWLRAAEHFVTRPDVCQTIIVISPEDDEVFKRRYTANIAFMDIQVVHGGAERFESVANALHKLVDAAEFVAIHDAVRPCLTGDLIDKVFAKAKKSGAAVLGVPVSDTVKQVAGNRIEKTLSRKGLWLAQTPQVFRRDWIEKAYADRSNIDGPITDDAQLVEAAGHPVDIVEGSRLNLKITTKADLILAAASLKAAPKPKEVRPSHPFAEEEMWK